MMPIKTGMMLNLFWPVLFPFSTGIKLLFVEEHMPFIVPIHTILAIISKATFQT